MEIGKFIKGQVNKMLGLDNDISEGRLRICYQCPLYSQKFGGLCNNRLWLNVETGDLSLTEKEGYKNGCGCVVRYKVKNTNSICPLGKW